jgi:hypothetical protein
VLAQSESDSESESHRDSHGQRPTAGGSEFGGHRDSHGHGHGSRSPSPPDVNLNPPPPPGPGPPGGRRCHGARATGTEAAQPEAASGSRVRDMTIIGILKTAASESESESGRFLLPVAAITDSRRLSQRDRLGAGHEPECGRAAQQDSTLPVSATAPAAAS